MVQTAYRVKGLIAWLLFKFPGNIDPKRAFTKILTSERKCKLAGAGIFSQTFNKRFKANISGAGEVCKSGFVTFEIFWAFHSPDNFFYFPPVFCADFHKNFPGLTTIYLIIAEIHLIEHHKF